MLLNPRLDELMNREEVVAFVKKMATNVACVHGCTDALLVKHEGKLHIQVYSISDTTVKRLVNRHQAIDELARQIMEKHRDNSENGTLEGSTLFVLDKLTKVEPAVDGRCRVYSVGSDPTLVASSVSEVAALLKELGVPHVVLKT